VLLAAQTIAEHSFERACNMVQRIPGSRQTIDDDRPDVKTTKAE
jgi:hypothetical protein